MSAGSCVASRSRSRLDISASVTWLKSDSRRASRRSRYDFVFLLSIALYAPSLTLLALKTCVYAARGPRFQKRPAELSLLIGQPARDGVSAVELLRQNDARHLVRQRQARERPAHLRPPPHLLGDAEVSAQHERHLLDRAPLPLSDPRGQLLRTPNGLARHVEQNRQSIRCQSTRDAFALLLHASPRVFGVGFAQLRHPAEIGR